MAAGGAAPDQPATAAMMGLLVGKMLLSYFFPLDLMGDS